MTIPVQNLIARSVFCFHMLDKHHSNHFHFFEGDGEAKQEKGLRVRDFLKVWQNKHETINNGGRLLC